MDKYFVTYFLVFVAWQICAIPLYRAEWKGIGIATGLLSASADERRAYSDGPIYPILKAAQELVPASHRVLFVNPATIGKGMTIFAGLTRRQDLKLVKAQSFDCGIVVLNYELKK